MNLQFISITCLLLVLACSPIENVDSTLNHNNHDILTRIVGAPIDSIWYNQNAEKDQHICVLVFCLDQDYLLRGQMFGYDTLFLSFQKSNYVIQNECSTIGTMDTCYWYDNSSPSDSVVFKYWNTDSTIKMVKLPARFK